MGKPKGAPGPGQTGLGRAANRHEAFRAILLLLAADPQYEQASIRVVHTVDRSIAKDQYYLLMHEGQVLGAILWCEISAPTRDACLKDNRGPTLDEALDAGDAIFCTAIVSRSSEAIRLLLSLFVDANKERDILFQRHFRDGGRAIRVRMFRKGRLMRG